MMSSGNTWVMVASTISFSILTGFLVGLKPNGEWRWFSWHPFLMSVGFIGMMGSAAMIKKLGGYTNTKLHGILASLGSMMALGGFYVIYTNKELLGKEHFTTPHGKAGLLCLSGALMVGGAGGVFLHPDFGIDKGNKTIRKIHSIASRCVIALGWLACFAGLKTIVGEDPKLLAGYCVPLLSLVPFVLIPSAKPVPKAT